MAQTIKLKRSATQGGSPTVSQLSLGEVAINTYDGKMYIKKDNGSESIVEIGGATSGGLPLSGGTMTGTLAMGANAITSTGIISAAEVNINNGGGNQYPLDLGSSAATNLVLQRFQTSAALLLAVAVMFLLETRLVRQILQQVPTQHLVTAL